MQGVPGAFGSAPAMSPQQGPPGGQAGGPKVGMPGGLAAEPTNVNGPVLPAIDEMDLDIQCDPKFLRSSVGKIVSSQAAANASKIPLGIVVKPMQGDIGTTNDDVEVVDFGSTGLCAASAVGPISTHMLRGLMGADDGVAICVAC